MWLRPLTIPTPESERRKNMTVTQEPGLQLTTAPETVNFPESHYVFIEKVGPFPTNAPQAWQELHKLIPELVKEYAITGYFSLYKVEPQIYRAGVSLAVKPTEQIGRASGR